MWGNWFVLTIGGTIGIVLLFGALVLTAWSPIFAVIIFIMAAVVLAAGASMKRSSQYVEGSEREGSAPRTPEAGDVIGKKSVDRGAPARGEGGTPEAQTLPPPTRP